MMKIKRNNLYQNVNLTHIETNKFKNNFISVSFLSNLTLEHASEHALLPSVLLRGTSEHPNLQSMSKKMEELYGSIFNPMVYKVGEIQVCGIYISCPEEDLLPKNSNVLEQALKFSGEIFQHPYTTNSLFYEDYVSSESQKLCSKIRSIYNNKRAYAQFRCIQEMCSGENFAIPALGTISGAEAINAVRLFNEYQKLIKFAPVEVFYCGTKSIEEFEDIFSKVNVIPERQSPVCIHDTDITMSPKVRQPAYKEEEANTEQTNLVMGFRLSKSMKFANLAALQLFNILFGGAPTSKLFTSIREAKSLCYFIDSSINISKGIMLVSAGTDDSDVQTVIQEVNEELDKMKRGIISNFEINTAKKTLINDVGILNDSASALEHFYIANAARKLFFTTTEYVKQIRAVDKNEIVSVAKNISLDQIFILRSSSYN